jgi:hypothetical protein
MLKSEMCRALIDDTAGSSRPAAGCNSARLVAQSASNSDGCPTGWKGAVRVVSTPAARAQPRKYLPTVWADSTAHLARADRAIGVAMAQRGVCPRGSDIERRAAPLRTRGHPAPARRPGRGSACPPGTPPARACGLSPGRHRSGRSPAAAYCRCCLRRRWIGSALSVRADRTWKPGRRPGCARGRRPVAPVVNDNQVGEKGGAKRRR